MPVTPRDTLNTFVARFPPLIGVCLQEEKQAYRFMFRNTSLGLPILQYHFRVIRSSGAPEFYRWIIPLRKAPATASVRSLAPSFSMMCLIWAFTVSSEMNRRSAMSRLHPVLISRPLFYDSGTGLPFQLYVRT